MIFKVPFKSKHPVTRHLSLTNGRDRIHLQPGHSPKVGGQEGYKWLAEHPSLAEHTEPSVLLPGVALSLST